MLQNMVSDRNNTTPGARNKRAVIPFWHTKQDSKQESDELVENLVKVGVPKEERDRLKMGVVG